MLKESFSHASEDKPTLVEPLVEALAARDLRVWYDAHDRWVGMQFPGSDDTPIELRCTRCGQ